MNHATGKEVFQADVNSVGLLTESSNIVEYIKVIRLHCFTILVAACRS